jgi:hypothetical protein
MITVINIEIVILKVNTSFGKYVLWKIRNDGELKNPLFLLAFYPIDERETKKDTSYLLNEKIR